MDTHTSQQQRFPAVAIVAIIFLLCIFPGQFWIAKLFPTLSGLARISPSFVFLDLPIDLPVSIDMILVPGLFFLIYPVVALLFPSRPGISRWRQATQRAGAVFSGLFVLLFCMASGALIYYLAQGYLSTRARNGIDSLGITADIHLTYPAYNTIHLRGGTVLLVCFIIGMLICIRKIRKEPGAQKAGQLTREQRMTPYERMVQEKRMQEKRRTQEAPIKNKGYKTDKCPQTADPDSGRSYQPAPGTKTTTNRKPAVIKQEIIRADSNNLSRLCSSQPVMTFKPEAVNYMPMS